MEQTSLSHVSDVMGNSSPISSVLTPLTALLGSFKAFVESFDRMHKMPLAAEVDVELLLTFLRKLLTCKHYVVWRACWCSSLLTCMKVLMFTLRWIYDCLDYFYVEHRAMFIRECHFKICL